MTTKEFRQYLIQYFEVKKQNRLYTIFKTEYERQRYEYRSSIERPQQK